MISMTTTVVTAQGTCTHCHATLITIDGVSKTQHVTKDFDWRCMARKGYKGHVIA